MVNGVLRKLYLFGRKNCEKFYFKLASRTRIFF